MGTPFRVPYGFALGRESAFNFRYGPTESGTSGLIKQASTCPDVTTGTLFYTNNTGATTIVALTCNTYGANTGYQDGRLIRLVFLDTATQVAQSGNIVLAGTGNFGAIGIAPITLDLMQMKGKWYEMNREPKTEQDYYSLNMSGTTNCSVNANGVQTVLVTQTGSATQFSSISGGYIGQKITVVFLNSAGSAITLTTGGNLTFGNTAGTLVMNTGGAVVAVKASTTTWYVLNTPSAKLV